MIATFSLTGIAILDSWLMSILHPIASFGVLSLPALDLFSRDPTQISPSPGANVAESQIAYPGAS
jgi:hypothetical protein